VIGGEIVIKDLIKKWRLLASGQTYSMYAAIYTECANDIEQTESETEQKLKDAMMESTECMIKESEMRCKLAEAVELLEGITEDYYSERIIRFLSTIKDKQ
jgi:hypothetical protein